MGPRAQRTKPETESLSDHDYADKVHAAIDGMMGREEGGKNNAAGYIRHDISNDVSTGRP